MTSGVGDPSSLSPYGTPKPARSTNRCGAPVPQSARRSGQGRDRDHAKGLHGLTEKTRLLSFQSRVCGELDPGLEDRWIGDEAETPRLGAGGRCCPGAVAKCRPRRIGIGSTVSNRRAESLPAQWVHRTSPASVAGLHRAPMGLALRVLLRAICNPAESPRRPEAEAIGEPDWDQFVVPWGESPQCRRSATLSARARQLTPKASRESRVSRCIKLVFGPLPN